MTTPRLIEPQDIRVDDRVRFVDTYDTGTVLGEFTVTKREGPTLFDVNNERYHSTYARRTWTLLDRPEPPREPGSHWLDPETGAEYVATDTPGAVEFYRYRRADNAPRQLNDGCTHATIIARLVPIPAFHPAVLWPRYTEGDECAAQDMNGLRLLCCRTRGHPGLHAAYAGGSQPESVWGDPR